MLRTLKVFLILVTGAILAGCSPETQSTSEESQQQKLFSECGVSKLVKSSSPPLANAADAPVGAFPWHAGIYFNREIDGKSSWQQVCAGSLITDRLVLTAAHCASSVSDPSEVRVALGKHYQSWVDQDEPTQEKHSVAEISIPREFSKTTYTFDIALLLLSEKVKISEHIMPVCLGFDIGPNNVQHDKLYVVGWKVGGHPSDTLMYNSVTALSEKQCQKYVPPSFSMFEKFCATKNNNSEEAVIQAGDGGSGVTAIYKDGLHFIVGLSSVKIKNINLFTDVTWPTHRLWIGNANKKYSKQ